MEFGTYRLTLESLADLVVAVRVIHFLKKINIENHERERMLEAHTALPLVHDQSVEFAAVGFEAWFTAGMEVLAYSVEGARAYFALESQKALTSVEAALSGVPLRR